MVTRDFKLSDEYIKVNKNSTKFFDFYKNNIFKFLGKDKNAWILLYEMGNINFIKFVKSFYKNVIVVDSFPLPGLSDFNTVEDAYNHLKEITRNKDMKFDRAIMNPPYDGNLHLKILENVIPCAKRVINISPIRWLKEKMGYLKPNSDFEKFPFVLDKIKKITEIDGVKAFNINWSELGIYVIDDSLKKEFEPKQWNKVPLFVENLYTKINKKDSLNFYMSENSNKKFFVRFPTTYNPSGGNPQKNLLGTDEKKQLSFSEKNQHVRFFNFNSKNEAINFYRSLFTKFYRFINLMFHSSTATPVSKLPYLKDYTEPWDDKRMCKYFGITGYISDTEAEPGSEWETVLNVMKDYQ